MSLEELDQQRVGKALDDALRRAEEYEQQNGAFVVDINKEKLVLLSDLHKGARNPADDFQPSEGAYNDALAYYFDRGYTLISLGDVEELWEERPPHVVKAYRSTLEREGTFHGEGRLLRVWGNHDDHWRFAGEVKKYLDPIFGDGVEVRESILIRLVDGQKPLGRLFLVHGHQGTLDSDRFAAFSRLFVRYVWRPIQRLIGFSFNTPATNWELRKGQDTALYHWTRGQEKLALIAGHTHRPVFKSISNEEMIQSLLEQAREKDPSQVARLEAELDWAQSQTRREADPESQVVFDRPSYFNTGCCAFTDGRITGLEIAEGNITLIRWPNDANEPKPKVLESAPLSSVYAEL